MVKKLKVIKNKTSKKNLVKKKLQPKKGVKLKLVKIKKIQNKIKKINKKISKLRAKKNTIEKAVNKKPTKVLSTKKKSKVFFKKTKKIQKKTPKKIQKKITKKIPKKIIKKIKKIVKKKFPKTLKKTLVKNKLKKKSKKGLQLHKSSSNPIMGPTHFPWESHAVFNPASIYLGGRVHLFYRAMGSDGVSRIGYASSSDGVNFDDRLFYPIYFMQDVEDTKDHWPYTSPARPVYDTDLYASGGGWGGCEDPRAVVIDGVVYITFNMFNGWHSMRVAVVSIKEADLLAKRWHWSPISFISRFGDRQKNWVLFPEKINGKFVIFHNLDLGDPNHVGITYVNKLDSSESPTTKNSAPDPHVLPDHIVAWHKRTRSAASPPIKTKDGWLLFYHAMDKDGSEHYKLGALMLDLKDPSRVLYRAQYPILEPEEWYENDWKPGIIYASGAIEKDGELFVYYGGGDKRIGVASISMSKLINSMKEGSKTKLKVRKINKIK